MGQTVTTSTDSQASQFNSQSSQSSQQSSSSASADYSGLVSQIITALRPSIALSVQEALEAQRFTSSQVTTQEFNSGSFGASTGSSSGISSGASFGSSSGTSSGASFGSFTGSSSGSSSGSVSGSSALTGIFGDGSASNVKIETPQYNIEY